MTKNFCHFFVLGVIEGMKIFAILEVLRLLINFVFSFFSTLKKIF
jgi:hypothetical protein